jgi:hypothetical protein
VAADGLARRSRRTSWPGTRLVEARNGLARAIAGAAISGMTRDEIVEMTGYDSESILRICQEARIST